MAGGFRRQGTLIASLVITVVCLYVVQSYVSLGGTETGGSVQASSWFRAPPAQAPSDPVGVVQTSGSSVGVGVGIGGVTGSRNTADTTPPSSGSSSASSSTVEVSSPTSSTAAAAPPTDTKPDPKPPAAAPAVAPPPPVIPPKQAPTNVAVPDSDPEAPSHPMSVPSNRAGPFAHLFTPEADAEPQTMWQCHSYGAWSDICVYRRLCFKGGSELIFMLNKIPKQRGGKIPKSMHQMGMRMSTKLPKDSFGDLNTLRYVPAYYKGSQIDFVQPDRMADIKPTPEWHSNRTMFVPAYQESLGNIWYYSSRVLPLYYVMTKGPALGVPSLENSDVMILGPEQKIKYDWHTQVLRLAVPPSATIHYKSSDPFKGLTRPGKGLTCFDTAVLTGAQVFGWSDWISAHTFRVRTYKALMVPIPQKPVPDVIILDRGKYKPRHISNVNEVLGLVKDFGFAAERVIFAETTTFKQQVELLARTGVLIAVHGAGLTNQMFMPPGSAVIEVFPVHVKHVLYERMAHYAGVYHFKIYSKVFEPGYHKRHPQYIANGCDNIESLNIPDSAACWPLVKNSNVVIPIPELREALVQAIDFVTRFRDPVLEGKPAPEEREWPGDQR